MPLPDFEEPPIVEVVCGFFFRPVVGLDPLSLGNFWNAHRKEFPRRNFVPALRELNAGLVVEEGLGPIRTWFISADDQYVLQIQNDRLYVNWRRRGDDYPTFTGGPARSGLRTTALDHFRQFEEYARSEFRAELHLTGCELAKIDHLEEGRHWKDVADLTSLLTPFGQLAKVAAHSGNPPAERAWGALPPLSFQLQFPMGTGAISVDIQTGLKPPAIRLLKIETKSSTRQPIDSNEVEGHFSRFNTGLNGVFEALLTQEAMKRFRRGYKP